MAPVRLEPTRVGRGQRTVDGDRRTHAPGEVHRRLADDEIELGPGQDIELVSAFQRPTEFGPQPESGHGATHRQALHKATARRLKAARLGVVRIEGHDHSVKRLGDVDASRVCNVARDIAHMRNSAVGA